MGNVGRSIGTILNPVAALNPLDPRGPINTRIGEMVAGGPRSAPNLNVTPGQVTQFSEEFRKQRELDQARGRERGQELFGKESDIQAGRQERANDIADIIRQRRSIAEQGFGSQAFQAARETRLRNIGRQEQQAQRQLQAAQGAGGVGGPLAAAQQAQLASDLDINRRDAEQRLMLEDVALRQKGLGDFEASVAAEQDRLRRLLLGIAGLEFGEASLGAQERGTAGQILTGANQAVAAQQGANPGLFSALFGGLFS